MEVLLVPPVGSEVGAPEEVAAEAERGLLVAAAKAPVADEDPKQPRMSAPVKSGLDVFGRFPTMAAVALAGSSAASP